MKKKHDLPSKNCPVCDRPFTWRKKWEHNWDEIIYCSQRCRNRRNQRRQPVSNEGRS